MKIIIAAVSQNGVIGVDNKIPFYYPEDLKHFRLSTIDSTIIMGRKTFESIGKPLPNRRNIVISSQSVNGVETYPCIPEALDKIDNSDKVWFIGGARIYEESMQYADEIHLTLTPNLISHHNAVRFPWINPQTFSHLKITPFTGDSELSLCVYTRE